MECIICGLDNNAQSVEHIVSESFGNTTYVMEKSKVCDVCNGKFSKSERLALSNTIFLMERARNGIKTKAGKPAKGKIGDLEIEGDADFKEQHIFAPDMKLSQLKDYDPKTNTYSLYVDSFDKNEVATSKMILKTAIEALYTSRRPLYNKLDLTELRGFLNGAVNSNDWPFITGPCAHLQFTSIPRFNNKYNLKLIKCELLFCELDDETFLFKFRYGGVAMVINLLSRDLKWLDKCLESDPGARLYPLHYRRKLEKMKAALDKKPEQ